MWSPHAGLTNRGPATPSGDMVDADPESGYGGSLPNPAASSPYFPYSYGDTFQPLRSNRTQKHDVPKTILTTLLLSWGPCTSTCTHTRAGCMLAHARAERSKALRTPKHTYTVIVVGRCCHSYSFHKLTHAIQPPCFSHSSVLRGGW